MPLDNSHNNTTPSTTPLDNNNNNAMSTTFAPMSNKKWKINILKWFSKLSRYYWSHNHTQFTKTISRLAILIQNTPTNGQTHIPPLSQQYLLWEQNHTAPEPNQAGSPNTDKPASVVLDINADLEELDDPELLFPESIVNTDDQPWAVINEPDPTQTNVHVQQASSVADSNMDVDTHPMYPSTPASCMNPLIKALTTMLTSPTIQGDVTLEDIRSFLHDPSKYPVHELELVAHLATTLRPYVRKKHQRSDGKPPEDAVEHDIKAWCPDPPIGQFDMLHLNMTGLYEVFFSSKGMFRVMGPDGLINSLLTAKKDPDLLFQSLLDMEHIHKMCSEHHVTFANRMSFSDPFTVNILVETIGHGDERQGYPTISRLKQDKKAKWDSRVQDWSAAYHASGFTVGQIQTKATALGGKRDILAWELAGVNKLLKLHEALLWDLMGMPNPQDWCDVIAQQRQASRELESKGLQVEAQLQTVKDQIYTLNKLAKAGK
ncbi:hypothetical protein BGZ74_008524 [Mortierella antarctica]|nr:hypothetical protein BGZ74_008524 [Mortierella antarctica]